MNNIKEIIKQKNKEISASLEYKSLSVSKVIESLKNQFDKEGQSKKCFENGFDDPNSKYYQMTQEDILNAWEYKANESKKYGNLLDSYTDMVLNEKVDELTVWKLDNSYDYNTRLNGICTGFDQFYNMLLKNTDYKYVTREEKMYIKSNKTDEFINGRFDCLFYSESSDSYLLMDWKNSEKIDKTNKFEKLKGPLYEYDACNLNEYSIQIQMYKKALCEVYGITTPDKIQTYICQMLATPGDNGNNYFVHTPIMDYSSERLDNVIEFAYKKRKMLNEKKDSKN